MLCLKFGNVAFLAERLVYECFSSGNDHVRCKLKLFGSFCRDTDDYRLLAGGQNEAASTQPGLAMSMTGANVSPVQRALDLGASCSDAGGATRIPCMSGRELG